MTDIGHDWMMAVFSAPDIQRGTVVFLFAIFTVDIYLMIYKLFLYLTNANISYKKMSYWENPQLGSELGTLGYRLHPFQVIATLYQFRIYQ